MRWRSAVAVAPNTNAPHVRWHSLEVDIPGTAFLTKPARLRESLNFSQPVFALHLHTTASTVRKWEQGETRPTGPALKLLNLIADKGLQAIL